MDNETKGNAPLDEITPKVIEAHCPDCGGMRKAYVRGEHVAEGSDDDGVTSWSDTGRILECCGCSRIFFRRDFWFSERDTEGEHPVTGEPRTERGVETTYWPAPAARKPPKWVNNLEAVDWELFRLLSEMYTALNNDLRVLAAIGARTVFDRSSELLGVPPKFTFAVKLRELCCQGKVSKDEHDTLGVLVDAGSAAGHRGWRPKPEELNTMMDVVETFLHRSFVLGDGIKKLKASIPPRP
jgi:uncharacterized protein DUF4145